jgi:hypothetical protein
MLRDGENEEFSHKTTAAGAVQPLTILMAFGVPSKTKGLDPLQYLFEQVHNVVKSLQRQQARICVVETKKELREHLNTGDFDVLHIACHGKGDGTSAMLPSAAGAKQELFPNELAEWLQSSVRPPACIYLDFCSSNAFFGPREWPVMDAKVSPTTWCVASTESFITCSEKDAQLAQKLGQLQPFLAVLSPKSCLGQLATSGPT